MASPETKLSRLRVAVITNNHVQQDHPGFLAPHPIGHPVERLAAVIAIEHNDAGPAIIVPFPRIPANSRQFRPAH